MTLIYMEAFIGSAGLKASDLDFVYAKATPDRLAALLSGGVDAAILYPPSTFRAGAVGYTYLGDIETYLKDFPFTVWAANTNWAAKNGRLFRTMSEPIAVRSVGSTIPRTRIRRSIFWSNTPSRIARIPPIPMTTSSASFAPSARTGGSARIATRE